MRGQKVAPNAQHSPMLKLNDMTAMDFGTQAFLSCTQMLHKKLFRVNLCELQINNSI